MLSHLESLAERLGVEVRYESLGTSAGGLCRVDDKLVLFVNKVLPVYAKIELFVRELNGFDIGEIYLLPQIRKLFDER